MRRRPAGHLTDASAVNCFFTNLNSLSISDLVDFSMLFGMCVAIEIDGSYALDESEAVGKLLRKHNFESANST